MASGVKVRGGYGKVETGKTLDADRRSELHKALDHARRRGIPLVVPCVSRLVRDADYHSHRQPNLKPIFAEFGAFLELAASVRILTMNDPNSSPPEDEAFIRRLTADLKGRNVGRPRKRPMATASIVGKSGNASCGR
jgi:hypothetical protein